MLNQAETLAKSIGRDARFTPLASDLLTYVKETRLGMENDDDMTYEMSVVVERSIDVMMKLHGPWESMITVTEAAERYVKEMFGMVEIANPKAEISVACKRGHLRYLGSVNGGREV